MAEFLPILIWKQSLKETSSNFNVYECALIVYTEPPRLLFKYKIWDLFSFKICPFFKKKKGLRCLMSRYQGYLLWNYRLVSVVHLEISWGSHKFQILLQFSLFPLVILKEQEHSVIFWGTVWPLLCLTVFTTAAKVTVLILLFPPLFTQAYIFFLGCTHHLSQFARVCLWHGVIVVCQRPRRYP